MTLTMIFMLILKLAAPQLPSAAEIYEALPPEGISIKNLIAKFRSRVPSNESSRVFIKLVRVVAIHDKDRSWLTPLPSMPSEEKIAAVLNEMPAAKAASPSSS